MLFNMWHIHIIYGMVLYGWPFIFVSCRTNHFYRCAMEILHDEGGKRFRTLVDGYTAHVAYEIHEKGLDIRHTVVPEAIGGRGIASALVKAVYDYALVKRLKPIATCSYAVAWLQRHPEYGGEVSECYGGKGTCAL